MSSGTLRRNTALTALVLLGAGCASALAPVPADSPLARADEEARDPRLAAELLERSLERFEQRPDRAAVLEAAELALRAALAAPDDPEPVILATRSQVWLASHPGDDRTAAERAARQAVEVGQSCRRRAPDHAPCDYWLALAVGVQADLRRNTALDGLRVMVGLLRAAIESTPELDHGGPERVLARVLTQAPGWPSGPGDPDEGLRLARAAVARAPHWPPNHLALADALREVGRREDAAEAYRTAAELARRAREVGEPDAPEWIEDAERGLGRRAPRSDQAAGQSQPNAPAVSSAYTSPSNICLAVFTHDRCHQIE